MVGTLVLIFQVFLVGITNTQTTLAATCDEPCSPCKVIPDGEPNGLSGNWNLIAKESPMCPGSCLYERDSIYEPRWWCFCDPGPISYEMCYNQEIFPVIPPKCPSNWFTCDNLDGSPCQQTNFNHTGYCCGASSDYPGCCAPYKSQCDKVEPPKFTEGLCWNDTFIPKLLKGPIIVPLNDRKRCYEECKNKHNPDSIFYGLENGNECYCGNTQPPTATVKQLPASKCSTPCPGNPEEFCGGNSSIIVYLTSSPPDGLCWNDTFVPKLLTNGPIIIPLNDETRCKAECKRHYPDSTHFGLENGTDCYCGDTTPPTKTVKQVDASYCKTTCPGNPAQFCGGSNYIMTFKI